MRIIPSLILIATLAPAQAPPPVPNPLIHADGILNAATLAHSQLPTGGIARGSLVWIRGVNFGPVDGIQAPGFPLTESLEGFSVTVIQGRVRTSAFPVYIDDGQILAVVPSDAPLGLVSFQITNGRRNSNLAPARITATAPGLFSNSGDGQGLALLQNLLGEGAWVDNNPSRSAKPTQTVSLYATGFGPLPEGGDEQSPPTAKLPGEFELFIGGKPATIKYAGRAPQTAGVDQLVFDIPEDAPTGCYVPIQLRVNNTISNTVTASIARNGGPCQDPHNPFSAPFRRGGNVGAAILLRGQMLSTVSRGQPNIAFDRAVAIFRRIPASPYNFNRLWSLPPAGACASYSGFGDPFTTTGNPGPEGGDLDAGALSITGPRGAKDLPFLRPGLGYYASFLSRQGQAPQFPEEPAFLLPGVFRWIARGGAALAAFSAPIDAGEAVEWPAQRTLATIPRTADLSLSWNSPAANVSLIIGTQFDERRNAHSQFVCLAEPGAQSFSVPTEILQSLPTSATGMLGAIMIGTLSDGSPSSPRLPGLSFTGLLHVNMTGRTVNFR